MQRLLADVDKGLVDQIVVYKIDRLTRSLADFAKIVERLDKAGASFVSVTQSFNTATSMGRLTLNMLLSFAQFEREITAERIRDKIAASKRKGLWMGGTEPFGYRANGRTLAIDADEAATVCRLYELYLERGSVVSVKEAADTLGLRTRSRKGTNGRMTGGGPFGRSHIHHILTNPLYAGRIRHRTFVHPGQHPPIIPPERWEEAQRRLTEAAPTLRGPRRSAPLSPLAGKLHDEAGDRPTPSHSRKNGHRLRYYISHRLLNGNSAAHPNAWRLPAPELEQGIAGRIRAWLTAPGQLTVIISDLAATEAAEITTAIDDLAQQISGPHHGAHLRDLVDAVKIAPGRMQVILTAEALAARLGLAPDRIRPDALRIEAPFRLRRRGVEAKLLLGDRPTEVDATLIRNIVKAQDWFAALSMGETYAQIAARDGTWPQRVQQLIGLAFLAPDIVQKIAEGRQPPTLTTEWLLANPLPADWGQQRARLAAL